MGKRILIVDRDGAAGEVFRAALGGLDGVHVHVAENGRSAAELLACLGERTVALLDIESPFLDLVAACSTTQMLGRDVVLVVCNEQDAAELEHGLAGGVRAVA